ncbi:MAG: hypothetical protein MUF65_13310 [Rubritepida sp.]|jgi:hypothetical protein|nr:hypothetical protein [Rubritepida sp.]MCU0946328.1 hypothetical protein [Rubritepida sp.]
MPESPAWLRLLFAVFALAATWGGVELAAMDQRGAATERAACLDANRAARAEASRAAAAGDTAAAIVALTRVGECPAAPAWPWALLAGGMAGLAVSLVLQGMFGRIARLEAAAPRAVAVGDPVPAPARRGSPPPDAAAPGAPLPAGAPRPVAPLAEDDPRVLQVTEEMRAQGLNISPEVARHVAALRAPRPEA